MDYKAKIANLQQSSTLANVPEDAVGFVLSQMIAKSDVNTILHIAKNDFRIESIKKSIKFFAPNVEVLVFPAWDCMPYDRVSPQKNLVARRIATLSKLVTLHDNELNHTQPLPKTIVIANAKAILQKILPRQIIRESKFNIKVGEDIDLGIFREFLLQNGYMESPSVSDIGDFVIHGNIIDIFATGYKTCLRIEFDNSVIKSIKYFDSNTQISLQEQLEEVTIIPVSEVKLNPDGIDKFRYNYRYIFGSISKDDILYESIINAQHYVGMEHWLPLFYDDLETIFDFVPNAKITMDEALDEKLSKQQNKIQDSYQTRKSMIKECKKSGIIYNPVPYEMLYLTKEDLQEELKNKVLFQFSSVTDTKNTSDERIVDMNFDGVPNFVEDSKEKEQTAFELLGEFLQKKH